MRKIMLDSTCYDMEPSGAESPRIRIIFKTFHPLWHRLKNLPSESPSVEIRISTDDLFKDRGETHSILVVIQAMSQKTVLSEFAAGDGQRVASCIFRSSHNANVTTPFLESCRQVIERGGEIPIEIVNVNKSLLCSLKARSVTSFSWRELEGISSSLTN